MEVREKKIHISERTYTHALVSIVIPVYNVEEYLEKCIQSIFSQTYYNLEIILVDDGSTDRSSEMCDEYSKLDERVVVIHKKNGGLSEARNFGIERSTGNYIMFVDSDDYISPYIVERLMDRMIENQADLSMCAMNFVDIKGESIKRQLFDDGILSGIEILQNKMLGTNWDDWGASVAKIYRKEIIDKIRFPVGKKYEDQYVAHRIYGQCNRVSIISEPMYFYLQRPGSILHSNKLETELYLVEALLNRTDYYVVHDSLKNHALFYLMTSIPYVHWIISKGQESGKKLNFDDIQSLYRKEAKLILKKCEGISNRERRFIKLNSISLYYYWRLSCFKAKLKTLIKG